MTKKKKVKHGILNRLHGGSSRSLRTKRYATLDEKKHNGLFWGSYEVTPGIFARIVLRKWHTLKFVYSADGIEWRDSINGFLAPEGVSNRLGCTLKRKMDLGLRE